jgi:hypothetical protein
VDGLALLLAALAVTSCGSSGSAAAAGPAAGQQTVTQTITQTVTVTVTAPPETVTVTLTTKAPAPAQPKAAGPAATIGNGTYIVGRDVRPGRYRSPAPKGSLCYFDQTDDSGKIVDQGVANEGPSIANLRSGLTFKSSGCQDWQKIG